MRSSQNFYNANGCYIEVRVLIANLMLPNDDHRDQVHFTRALRKFNLSYNAHRNSLVIPHHTNATWCATRKLWSTVTITQFASNLTSGFPLLFSVPSLALRTDNKATSVFVFLSITACNPASHTLAYPCALQGAAAKHHTLTADHPAAWIRGPAWVRVGLRHRRTADAKAITGRCEAMAKAIREALAQRL
jgi:hypothetical protein